MNDAGPAAPRRQAKEATINRAGRCTAAAVAAIATLVRAGGTAPAQPLEVLDRAEPARDAGDHGPRSWLAPVRKRRLRLLTAPAGRPLATLAPVTEFGSPRVLSVLARRGDWLGVITSGLPNGRLGWLRKSSTRRVVPVRTWVDVDLSRRMVHLMSGRLTLASLRVSVGRPESSTPIGEFAVTDKLDGRRINAVYGRYILALSGNQPRTPRGWTGGRRLAIHGLSGPAGRASTAGCLEVDERGLRTLVRHVPLGTRVRIRP